MTLASNGGDHRGVWVGSRQGTSMHLVQRQNGTNYDNTATVAAGGSVVADSLHIFGWTVGATVTGYAYQCATTSTGEGMTIAQARTFAEIIEDWVNEETSNALVF